MVNLSGFFRVLIALAAGACVMTIAACGSSGVSAAAASGGRSPDAGAALKFAACMRSHGVPNFPDPSGGGGGIHFHLSAGSGITPFSPAFKAAQTSCRKLLPGGGPGAQHPTAQDVAQTLKVSECMRRHGVSGFPDPTLTPPANPSPSSYSILEDRGGVVLAVPSTINPSSPVFTRAAAVCGFS